jgi:Bacterial SH3 domain
LARFATDRAIYLIFKGDDVMKRLLEAVFVVWLVALAAVASAQTLRVTADRTNVRDKASTDGAIVVAVAKGDELEVVDKSGNWYHVRVKSTGAQGYVNALVVEVVAADSSAPTRPSPPSTPRPSPSTPPAPTAQTKPAAQGSSADRTYFVRVFGGLWSGYSTTGFGFGGGIAGRPFGNDEVEIEGDLAYARQSLGAFSYSGFDIGDSYSLSARLIQGSANLLYNFKLSGQSFTPFVGGGLIFSNESLSGTSTVTIGRQTITIPSDSFGFNGLGFQAIGGIEKPINDKMALRIQVRAGNGVLLLGGLSF